MARKKMKKQDVADQLKKLVAIEYPRCAGIEGEILSIDRANLVGGYLGNLYEHDTDRQDLDWSTYIDRTILETVEWAKPGLLRIFSSSPELVAFDYINPQDEAAAEAATLFVNRLLYNSAFELTHNVIHDSLLQRVGWAVAYYDKRDEVKLEEWAGLLPDEAAALIASFPDIEDAEIERRDDPELGEVVDVKYRRTSQVRKIAVKSIPPDNVIYSKDATSMEDCTFCAYWQYKMRGELMEEGVSRELLESVGTTDMLYPPATRLQQQVNAAFTIPFAAEDTDDWARVRVRVWEAYTFLDINGDGISERIKVRFGGRNPPNVVIFDWEEWPLPRPPLFPVSSVPLSHTPVGMCLADLVSDLQVLRTELTRMLLDNLYLNNQGEVHVNKRNSGEVDLEKLYNRRAGGVIESEGEVLIEPLPVGSTSAQAALGALEVTERIGEVRTGIGRQQAGLQADVLQNTATAAAIMDEASNQRLEMVARVIAETFFKPLAKYILLLAYRYQLNDLQFRIGEKVITANPRMWNPEWDVKASVGLGTGNRAKQVEGMQIILGLQEKIMTTLGQNSPVRLKNVYKAIFKLARGLGEMNPEAYFGTDGDAEQAEQRVLQQASQQPQQNPALQIEMEKAKIAQFKAEQEIQLQKMKIQATVELQRMEMQAKIQLEREKAEMEAQLKAQQMAEEMQLDRTKLMMSPTPGPGATEINAGRDLSGD